MASLLSLRDVWMEYPGRRGSRVVACRGVSLTVAEGEVVGLVGESGSGKSTVANLALGLLAPTRGEVRFRGEPVALGTRRQDRARRAHFQAVFQEPLLALDHRRTIGWSIAEPLRIHGRGGTSKQRARVGDLLDAVGLDRSMAGRRPSQLSGGQLQRVNIARAIALDPSLLICDEAVSALDVSVQAQIINLFLEIQASRGIGMLFISHDLAVVRHLSDRLVVMYAGQVVEEGPTEEVVDRPHHPYTRALMRASLEPTGDAAPEADEPPAAREAVPTTGCPFVPRCPLAEPACAAHDMALVETAPQRVTACRRAGELTADAGPLPAEAGRT